MNGFSPVRIERCGIGYIAHLPVRLPGLRSATQPTDRVGVAHGAEPRLAGAETIEQRQWVNRLEQHWQPLPASWPSPAAASASDDPPGAGRPPGLHRRHRLLPRRPAERAGRRPSVNTPLTIGRLRSGPSPTPAARSRSPARACAWTAPRSSTCWRSTTARPACSSTRAASTSRPSRSTPTQPYQVVTPRGTISAAAAGRLLRRGGLDRGSDAARRALRRRADPEPERPGACGARRRSRRDHRRCRHAAAAHHQQRAAAAAGLRGRRATARSSTTCRRSICRPASPATRISTPTAAGATTAATASVWAPRSVPAGWAALPHRPLVLRAAVGLDLGRRAAVGLRALSLRPLGQHAATAGCGCRRSARRVRSMRRRWSPSSAASSSASTLGAAEQRAGRLVPAGTARGLCAVLHDQSRLLSAASTARRSIQEQVARRSLAARAAPRAAVAEPAELGADEPALRHGGAGRDAFVRSQPVARAALQVSRRDKRRRRAGRAVARRPPRRRPSRRLHRRPPRPLGQLRRHAASGHDDHARTVRSEGGSHAAPTAGQRRQRARRQDRRRRHADASAGPPPSRRRAAPGPKVATTQPHGSRPPTQTSRPCRRSCRARAPHRPR